MGKLALLFMALPVAELLTLVRLGRAIGGFPTFLILLASAILGALIARSEGLRVLAQMRQAVPTGTMPSQSVLNGVLILFAALLLIVPGVISDVLALALLIPWSRGMIATRVVASVGRAIAEGQLRIVNKVNQVSQARPTNEWTRPSASGVIDTEGETVESSVVEDEDVKPPRLNS